MVYSYRYKFLAIAQLRFQPAPTAISASRSHIRQLALIKPQGLNLARQQSLRLGLSSLAFAAGCLGFANLSFASDRVADKRVTVWQGSPTPGATFYSPGCPSDVGLNNQTVRNMVFISAGGRSVRARISNAAGSQPLRVGSASLGIAISAGSADTVPGTLHPLRFSGRDSIVVAQGGEAISDPVPLSVKASQTLAVSVYLPGNTGPATQHYFARQDNYLATGDQTVASSGQVFTQPISCWMFVSGVDVIASPQIAGTLITLGDSITDGFTATVDENTRYPDFLARRLNARSGPRLAVANAGITGNLLLVSQPDAFGFSAPSRLARDVLTQPGARAVILLEGTNDIGRFSSKAEDLIAVDQQIILQAHGAGLKIYGGTLPPFAGSNPIYGGDFGTANGDQERTKLNRWILTSGAFDGVIDFDKALRDPANLSRMLPLYDSGDHVHPNDGGYEAMANAVNLDTIIDAIH